MYDSLRQSDRLPLQQEINKWADKNFPREFGEKEYVITSLGLSEEICDELGQLILHHSSDITAIEDAIGDAGVFLFNLIGRMNMNVDEILQDDVWPSVPEGSEPNHIELWGALCISIGKIHHCVLKKAQGIRGDQDDIMKKQLKYFIFLLEAASEFYVGRSFASILERTWAHVGMRDWIRFPENGVDK